MKGWGCGENKKNFFFKKDRRNTYISLTEKGWKKGEEVRDRMQDFGCSVMSQLKEEDIDQLVDYLDRIYEIAEKN